MFDGRALLPKFRCALRGFEPIDLFFRDRLPANVRRTKRCSRCKRNVDQRDLIARQRQHFAALRVGKARRRIENIRARPQSDIKLPLFRRQRARGEHRLQSRGKDALPTLRQRIKRIEHLGANRLLARLTRCQSLHPLQDRRPHPRLRRLIAQRNFGA